MPRLLLPVLLVAWGAALLLSGCGGDDAPAVAVGPSKPIVLDDFEFEPHDVVVRQGDTLSVINNGGTAHNLTIERGPNPRRESDELAGTDSFLKGGLEELDVNMRPGNYVMVCTVPGHRALGMVGKFRVRGSGT
jgi:plastocyanin